MSKSHPRIQRHIKLSTNLLNYIQFSDASLEKTKPAIWILTLGYTGGASLPSAAHWMHVASFCITDQVACNGATAELP